MALLEVKELDVYYGTAHVLQGLSFEVPERETVLLLGRNGVGKTTTLKTIVGLVRAGRGEIRFRGEAISGRPVYEIARRGIGLVPQGRHVFPTLTIREHLEVALRNHPDRVARMERMFQYFPELRAMLDRKGKNLSGGQQQMVAIVRALAPGPSLLVMDEPTEGLAPAVVERIGDFLSGLKVEGLTILMAEQNLGFALDVMDRGYVIEKGRIHFEGDRSAFLAGGDSGPALESR